MNFCAPILQVDVDDDPAQTNLHHNPASMSIFGILQTVDAVEFSTSSPSDGVTVHGRFWILGYIRGNPRRDGWCCVVAPMIVLCLQLFVKLCLAPDGC